MITVDLGLNGQPLPTAAELAEQDRWLDENWPSLPDCQCAADTAVICVQLAVDALKSLHTSAQATLWVNHLSEDLKTLRLFAQAQGGHSEPV